MTPQPPDYDQLADLYDETRGGETRGDDYAADVHVLLAPGRGPVLEIGVGTGVVALGLLRRGRKVMGVDISSGMLRRAYDRIGPVVARGDAMRLPVHTSSVDNAFSVWVLQAVPDPAAVVAEAARVIRPGGRYVVCLTQHSAPDDNVGQILAALHERIRARSATSRHVDPSAEQVAAWGEARGLGARLETRHRTWSSPPSDALDGIRQRMWAALRTLDEDAIEEVTRPAVEALQALPESDSTRHSTSEIVVLERS